jgi:hypothetical protein
VPVAALRRTAAEDDADEAPSVALDRGDEVEAACARVAGLDAVGAGIVAQQVVVVAVAPAVPGEALTAEVGIVLREVRHDPPAEQRHVARGRELAAVRQPAGVAEGCAAHAERARPLGHGERELVLGLAQRFRDHGRDIVRRLGDQRQDRVLDADRLAGLESQFRGRLAGRAAGDLEPRVERKLAALQRLEDHEERHDLGKRGRIVARIRIGFVQHAAGLGIDDDGGVFGLGGRRQRPRQQQQGEAREENGLDHRCAGTNHDYPNTPPSAETSSVEDESRESNL